jgi:hypothetical protein
LSSADAESGKLAWYSNHLNKIYSFLKIIFNYAEKNFITVVLDEFQNYQFVDPCIFSELQNLWDQKKEKTRCNLILMGSISTLMNHIFKNQKEPLFGRADHQLTVNAFTLE